MKNIKKNDFFLYAIALMLVTAGYFNYTTFEHKTEETYSEDIQELSDRNENIGDAVLVSSNEVVNNENINDTVQIDEKENLVEYDESFENENTNIGTTSTISDYYVTSKLDRDKMYAEMISNYEKMINNVNCSEAQKNIATQEITKINDTKNAIMISENLILSKGVENCVIFVNDSSINVVVKAQGGLKKEDVAKIQNIVSRELGAQIENVHIAEK